MDYVDLDFVVGMVLLAVVDLDIEVVYGVDLAAVAAVDREELDMVDLYVVGMELLAVVVGME